MASNTLKRKARRNIVRAKARKQRIKSLTAKPVIPNVDIDGIKEQWAKEGKGKASAAPAEETATPKAEEKPVAEEKVETVVEAAAEAPSTTEEPKAEDSADEEEAK